MKNQMIFALAFLIAAHCGQASAQQFAKPEDAIKYRKNALFVMGQHFARVGAMASGRVPMDAKVLADNAAIVETMSKLPWPAFVEGTDKGDTKAKPEIWKDAAKFKEASEKMQFEVVKLNVAAKSGKVDDIKTAAGAVGAACKACHDQFRQ